jgi:hypothetical protein
MGNRHRRQKTRPVLVDLPAPAQPARKFVGRVIEEIVEDPQPILARTFDPGDVNPILNHPQVLPLITIPGIETIDIAPLITDPRNVFLMAKGGCIGFCIQEPGLYEVHTNFLPEHRGRNAIRASLAAYRWMFTHTDCMGLQTRVPAFNKVAAWFCTFVGATREFERKAVWPTKDGLVDMSFWSLRYEDWVRKTPALNASGHAFHVRLEAERIRHGVQNPLHADEDCHDRYVGACVEMIYGGQPEKAVVLYNRWAAFAGYGPIRLVARSPLVIDIADALLQAGDGDFKVIKFTGSDR